MDNVVDDCDDQLLSSARVEQLARCSSRQLDYLARLGVVHPTVRARGKGTQRRWTVEDAALVAAVMELRALGAKEPVCRRFVAALGEVPELWSTRVLVHRDGSTVPLGIAPTSTGWVVDLPSVRVEVGAPLVHWPSAA